MVIESYVRDSLRLAFPHDYTLARLVAAFTAYFDESGTHQGAPALCVAGYVSTAEQWEDFEDEWNEALVQYNIPFFHMTDFNAGQGPYRDWPQEQRQPRLRKLTQIINRHTSLLVGAMIRMQDYLELSQEDRDTCDSPYRVAAMQCSMEIAHWIEAKHHGAEVNIIFELGAAGMGKLTDFFRDVMKDAQAQALLRVLSVEFRDKRKFVPLQAADIVANTLYQNLPRALGSDVRPFAQHLPMLGQVTEQRLVLARPENLRTMAQTLRELGLGGPLC
jgi:hypothetical protein